MTALRSYNWNSVVYSPMTLEPRKPLDIGEGFILKAQPATAKLLREKGLLGKGVLYLANELADITAKKESLPKEEWQALNTAMDYLTVTYDTGELYYYLLHAHGPDAINFNLWVRFSLDSSWPLCIRTFTEMPAEVLEEYGRSVWHQRRRKSLGKSGREKIFAAIGKRTDLYGLENMPTHMAVGLLFDEEL